MSTLPDTTRLLLLAVARALHTTGYRRPFPAPKPSTGGRLRTAEAQLDTAHHLEFEPAPRSIPGQARLTIRHGAQQIVWDGLADASDAVTLLARLGVIGTCRTCDVPVPAGEVECDTHARMTLDLPTYAVPTGRHAAHEAA